MSDKVVLFVRLFIAICFIALAGCVVYFQKFTHLDDTQTYGFAILLVIYGIFRIWRAIGRKDDIVLGK